MPTHDYILSNQSGASFRTDLNNALAAIVSNNSNSSSPATTYAYQWWADTTANILKIRNSSNNAWINLFTLAGGIDVDAASNFNEDVTFTGASANIVFDKSDNALEFADNAKATFGASADLQIFHDGSSSNISEQGTGSLVLKASTIDLTNAAQNEFLARFFPDSANELYFDGSRKWETTTNGVNLVDKILSFQGVSTRNIRFRDGENDMIFEFDSGDFYRQNIGSSQHEFFTGNNQRLTIMSGGQVTVGSTDTDPWNNTGNNPATILNATNVRGGLMSAAAFNGDVLALNRTGSDGDILLFYAQGVAEGNVSVSGNTVSFNGGHLSRWTKIPSISDTDKSKRPTIYRGSVLTNLDAMCEWKRVEYTNNDNITKTKPYSGSEDIGSTVEYTDDKGDKYSAKVVLETNEQLNKMELSSVEGDANVAGVFQGWDDDDDVIVNDLYCAMTGDFVIRIAKGVAVQRGDLLMSAGDGTAKPQGDDIVRSKTVAKVTSTTVSTTYDDGSFCVPCVLMAC